MYIILVVIFSILFYNYYWKRRNLPPGPAPLPGIGNVHQISQNLPGYKLFTKWHKEYNGMYTYWLGENPIVAVTDFKLMIDLFVKDADTFTGRTATSNFNRNIRGGEYGIVFIDGDIWKNQRRFIMSVFRDLGMSKPVMEEKIMLEIGHTFDEINEQISEKTNKGIVNIASLFELTVANIINQICFGFGYHTKGEMEEFAQMKDMIAVHMRNFIHPSMLLSSEFPNFFKYTPYFGPKLRNLKKEYDVIIDYCKKQVDNYMEQERKYGQSEEFEHFLAAYMQEIKKESFGYNERQLLNVLYDLFVSGQETTAYSVVFSTLYALNYPETQKKVHEELDRVIGNRAVTVKDRPKLTYCQAYINEVMRFVNLLPQNVMHRTTQDTEIKGYKIKKGTSIVPQICVVLYDETIFPEPFTFKPERFIDENGNLKKIEELVPFSIGKRQCLAESLARMELHLIVTNFFNNYKISPHKEVPSLEKLVGITVQNLPFQCVIEKRH